MSPNRRQVMQDQMSWLLVVNQYVRLQVMEQHMFGEEQRTRQNWHDNQFERLLRQVRHLYDSG